MSVFPTGLARAALVGLLAALVVATGGPAYADETFVGNPDGATKGTIGGTRTTTHTTPGQSGSPSADSPGTGSPGTGYTGPAAPSGTSPAAGSSGAVGGQYPLQQCGSYQGSTFVPYACPADPADPAEPEPGQPPAPPQVTTEMVTEAARVVAPTSPPHVEPGTVSYVNIPNNYWTESPTVRDSVTVLGQVIPLVWTPTSTTWDFGDGSGATGDGVEGADVGSEGAIEHSYARQGSYQISTTTTYNLTFLLPGQGAQTIPLTATPSAPVTLPVREIQTLVDFTS
jgi:hypothetical protein